MEKGECVAGRCVGITDSPEGEGDELRGGGQRDSTATRQALFGPIHSLCFPFAGTMTSQWGSPSDMVEVSHICGNSTLECVMPV